MLSTASTPFSVTTLTLKLSGRGSVINNTTDFTSPGLIT